MKIFLVDDDTVFYDFLKRFFPHIELVHFRDGYSFFAALEKEKPDRVIVDLSFDKLPEDKLISRVPSKEGLLIVKKLRENYPEIGVLLVSRFGTVEVLRELQKLGVPFLDSFTSEKIAEQKLREFFSHQKEMEDLEKTKELFANYGFYTESQYILSQLSRINLEKGNRENILIIGESGTGKSFLARVLHKIIFSEEAPFQELNLIELPPNLVESQLFGCEEALTRSCKIKTGCLEQAKGGTLFIDEIGFLSFQQQEKLAKVLEEGSFSRVGGSTAVQIEAKIIGTISSDPVKTLRKDLFYKFSSIVYLPPLREHRVKKFV